MTLSKRLEAAVGKLKGLAHAPQSPTQPAQIILGSIASLTFERRFWDCSGLEGVESEDVKKRPAQPRRRRNAKQANTRKSKGLNSLKTCCIDRFV